MKRFLPFLISAVIIIGGALWFLGQKSPSIAANAQSTDSAMQNLPDHIADRVLGDPYAPVTIVEYASLTCIHCDRFHEEIYPQIKAEFIDTGKAKLIYREVYFDGAGLLAASLARCVAPEQYFPMIETLFAQDENWLRSQITAENTLDLQGIRDELSKLGTLAGLGRDDINACLDDREKQEDMIANAEKNIQSDNVSGTPTIFVNGRKIDDWNYPNLSASINKALGE